MMSEGKSRLGNSRILPVVLGLALTLVLAACGGGDNGGVDKEAEPTAASASQSDLTGVIEISGSSTVFPITESVIEEFGKLHPGVTVNLRKSGTGKGFVRFTRGDVDIVNASRPITQIEDEAGVSFSVFYLGIQVAIDGLSVTVNPNIDFVECLTVGELKKIWEPDSKVNNWSQVRAGFPDRPLTLYGPEPVRPEDMRLGGSGTFDYFTENIVGELEASRLDYTASVDPDVLVQGISGDPNALGYFGYAYYANNSDKLKLVSIDAGAGCVTPTAATIESGEYEPLSRPLFIYVNTGPRRASIFNPEVRAFVEFYLNNAGAIVSDVGYVPLEESAYQDGIARVEFAITGGR